MLTKLANWFKNLKRELAKTDAERYFEKSVDINDLEQRIKYYSRNQASWGGRYY